MPQIRPRLSEKRIVVLGGSSGIGLAVAQHVVARGAWAIIASSNADRVKQAVATLDGKAEGYTLDLSNERDIQKFSQKIGDFDHLVFTAGDTLQLNELVATDLTNARHAFELRYWAVLAAVKHASTYIREGGSIVLTTGIAITPSGTRSERSSTPTGRMRKSCRSFYVTPA